MFTVREVHDDSAPRIRQFLAGRREFGYMTDWDPMFRYPWKIQGLPYGYAMYEKDEIVGFLGTIFSERVLRGQRLTECNIMAWVVDEGFRNRLGPEGKGVGHFLMDPILKMPEVVIAATTPNPRSKVSCRRLGFTTWDEEQVVVPLFPGLVPFAGGRSRRLIFESGADEIEAQLDDGDKDILRHHRDLRCAHFLVKDRESRRYCYFIGTISLTARRPVPNCRILNLCYLSDAEFFTSHFSLVRRQLWTRERISFLRYDSRFIASRLSSLERRMPQLRLIRSTSGKFLELDNLYSELVAYNKN